MKKIVLSALLLIFLALPVLTLAQTPETIPDLSGQQAIDIVTKNIVNWVFTILLITATILIVVAGFLFVTSGGNDSQLKQARQMILYGLIGIAVAFLARGIINLVGTILKG